MSTPRIRKPSVRRGLATCLAWLALASPGPALAGAPVRYELDPVHTRVLFSVSHAGFSQALGTVSGSHGALVFDPDDWSGATLEVDVPLQRLDLGDADWNRAALARNLLDAQRWPVARFVSTRVEALAPDRFVVHGELTLHGVTREVPLQVSFNALKRHPLPPFRRTAGFSATATISRSEFGIDAWPSVIGDQVELRIEAEAVRGTRDGGTPEGPVAQPAEDTSEDTPNEAPAEAVPPAAEPGDKEPAPPTSTNP
jgi:polyisoprenoid-binding protein YceI